VIFDNFAFLIHFHKHISSVQKPDVAAQAFRRGKGRKRSLPASTDKEPVVRKKFGIEVQQSTTRMSEFGGSINAIWVTILSDLTKSTDNLTLLPLCPHLPCAL